MPPAVGEMVGVGESIEDGGRMGNRESGRVTRKKKVDESETVSEVLFFLRGPFNSLRACVTDGL
jgi:hypothetical protein